MRRTNILGGLLVAIGLLFTLEATQATAASPKGKGGNQGAWQDDFNGNGMDRSRWVIVSGQAPGYIARNHIGYYDPTHVSVQDGYLVISLAQENGAVDNVPGAISKGGLIYTKDTYGYGTYEWGMRMSSTSSTPTGPGLPVSGSVSAGFIYVNNSQTEIDFEFAAHLPGWLYMSNWNNRNPQSDPTDVTYSTAAIPEISTNFKTYKFVWEKGRITFYIDGVFQTSHLTNVPSASAHFMINHWGTNNPSWGGTATVGKTRTFYVDWVRYTPAP